MADKNAQDPLLPEESEEKPHTPDETNETDDTGTEAVESSEAPESSASDPALEPVAVSPLTTAPQQSPGRFKRFLRGYWAKKKWTLPLTIVVLLVVVLAIPFTRYAVLGTVVKKQVSVSVYDSITNTPVSGATVSIGGQTLKTQGSGKASGMVKVGPTKLTITKQYYKTQTQNVTVGLADNNFKLPLQATGRQVPLSVVNEVTGKGIADVEITVLNTEAKTDKDGKTTIVLPTSSSDQQAEAVFKKSGFNDLKTHVQVTNKVVEANTFKLAPAGKLYFLSNKSGTLDVVKANLDGSDRQVVLAGTGQEDARNTSLLVSRNWKYLALLSHRQGANSSVYLIDTTQNDKLTTIDEGDANFYLAGWSNDTFVYRVSRNNTPADQSSQALKSYNATTSKLNVLDQVVPVAPEGLFQDFGSPYIINDHIFYAKTWSGGFATADKLSGKSAELVSIKNDGSEKKTVRSFSLVSGAHTYNLGLEVKSYAPTELYLAFNDGNKTSFYEYENGGVKDASNLTEQAFFDTLYPTFLLSPSGKQTFWSEQRDGKNAFFLGDSSAGDKKQITTQAEYTPFGWYSDDYLLVAKQSSELYIMPADGSQTPQKITDYYKPPINYSGYGGGYGGL